jgi:magnesium-transporting ATPase (P-type)
LFLGVIEAATAMAAFFFVLHGGGWSFGQSLDSTDPLYRRATTACLSAIVVMQIINVYVCRSSIRSVFSMRWFDNPIIVAGVALEIALIIVINYTAWGNVILETAPVPGVLWVFLMPFAAGMLLLEEIRKWIVRRFLVGAGPIQAPQRAVATAPQSGGRETRPPHFSS